MELPYRGSGKAYLSEKEYQCDLYYDEKQTGIVLKINVNNEKTIANYLEVPIELSYLHGQLDNGFKFTLLHLRRIGTKDLISDRRTMFSFSADYILCGVGERADCEQTFHKVEFTLSDILEWGEESVYKLGDNFELIRKDENVCKPVYKEKDVTINYAVHGSWLPLVNQDLLNEHIDLKQNGVIEVCFEEEKKLEEFIEIFEKVKRLIEIASLRKINVEKVVAFSSDIGYSVGNKKIEYPIAVYGRDIKDDSVKHSQSHRWEWVSLSELIEHNSFESYFSKHEKLAPIVELFLDPLYEGGGSETRVFLNIVQALETYHSRFVTNDVEEFKKRVEKITKDFPLLNTEKFRKFFMTNSNGFITLQSRIADLLFANGKIRFDTGKIEMYEFPKIVAHTRNYYIHYDERIKEKHKVLTEEELNFYNRSLYQILEYYILQELGFSDSRMLKDKITERWGRVSQDMDIFKMSREKNTSCQ